ncbi:MAG: hypothetical protein K6C32_01565 [Bacilli bacterium]|nr:hypothetical protein [Bacilli bacterium]
MYRVTILYPDGHVEELEETFSYIDKAIKFGEDYLNQVNATEQFKGKKYGVDFDSSSKGRKASFRVEELIDDRITTVFDSAKR